MYNLRRVLAATDGSEHGQAALITGSSCAERFGAELAVVSVAEAVMMPLGVETATLHQTVAEDLQRKVLAQVSGADLGNAPVHLRRGLAAPTINEVADEIGADLIVVGAHPRPAVARFLVGSTAERVIRLAHTPVLVATDERSGPFQRILAAIDLSPQSRRVLDVALGIAEACGSAVRALYVQDRLTPMLLEAALFDEKETRHAAAVQLRKTLAKIEVPSEVMMSQEIREGHAGHEILHAAEEWGADLIVMGTHGFGFFNRLLLGSISVYVLRHGHRATLVVPRSGDKPT